MKKIIQWNRDTSRKLINRIESTFGTVGGVDKYFKSQIAGNIKEKTVLEIGGTSRPLFSKDQVKNYIGLDIDRNFDFNNYYHHYFPQSCEERNNDVKADLIFSKYLLEHVPNNLKTFENIENWLNEGGLSIHIFPLAYHPFSIANRLVGNKFAKKLIPILRPGTEAITGYPAFYNQCNSFDLKRISNKSNLRYEIKYFFEAEDYFAFFLPFSISIHLFNRFCAFFRLNIFASNAVLIIKR